MKFDLLGELFCWMLWLLIVTVSIIFDTLHSLCWNDNLFLKKTLYVTITIILKDTLYRYWRKYKYLHFWSGVHQDLQDLNFQKDKQTWLLNLSYPDNLFLDTCKRCFFFTYQKHIMRSALIVALLGNLAFTFFWATWLAIHVLWKVTRINLKL